MKKRRVLRFLLLSVTLACTCLPRTVAAAPAFPVTVRDARGVPVAMQAAPRRIISLSPAITEMLFALGLGKAIVGDTVYCDYPLAARRVAKIGDMNTNYERVLALRPDLIVGDTIANPAAVARLGSLHQPLFAIRPDSFSDVEQSLRALGQVTGTARQAALVVIEMEKKRREAAALAAHDARHPRVLIVVGVQPLWTAGWGTFVNDAVSRAGGVNIAADLSNYAPLSKEIVLAHPPDLIMAAPKDRAALKSDLVLRALPAVRAGRFFWVTDENVILRPGPRLADGLLQVARALHSGAK